MSGLAALASVSELHGVQVSFAEILALGELGAVDEGQTVDEGAVLVLGRALGFEAVAMEGGYGDLPSVSLPLLVALREDETRDERYAVLHSFDDDQATVGDPASGAVAAWPRERFCAAWTGSVVQLTAVDVERRALAGRLVEMRDPWRRFARRIGWTAPYARRMGMVAASALALSVAGASCSDGRLDAATTWLLAGACVGSLWSWLGSDACDRCNHARSLAPGLPLAQSGAALYGGLLVGRLAGAPPAATDLLLAAAVAGHAVLLTLLARARVACAPCLAVAVAAAGALVLSSVRGEAPPLLLALAAVTSGVALALLVRWLRARAMRVWRDSSERLANQVAAEPFPGGRVRVVAFKREGCASCAFYESAVKPDLMATFEDAILVEERDPGRAPTVLPLIVVLGGRRTLFIGLPPVDAHGRIVEAIRDALAPPETGTRVPEMTVYFG